MADNNINIARYLQWGSLVIIPIFTVMLSSGVTYYQNKKRDDFEKFKFAQEIMEKKDASDEQKDWALKQMAIYFADSDVDMGNNLKYIDYYIAIGLVAEAQACDGRMAGNSSGNGRCGGGYLSASA